ncbi:TPA: threonylcarbamoyl-AMP synthase, partial [Candidatus Micrarchaeota archaeon]|nr:threonylcarbamoyl-AMP synthase [Candidatus Micrarchaeota archaeon]
FKVKGVAKVRPLPLLASDISDVERVAVITPYVEALAKEFWPGPLTMVLKARVAIPATLYGDTVTVRIPGSDVARKIAFHSGGLVVGTGARSKGGSLPTTLSRALKAIGHHVALAIDGGSTKFRKPSTVVSLVGKPRVLRSGPIRRRDVGRVLSRA